ncbi:hypothetical protein ACJ2CR_22265 [Myxococcus faecalis]|uniref:hypothetical protein n=1 Tax=Myxococcus TaxID=32 RepID=UPI001CC05703|nr:hypothetical protein [Myxococcus sp. XM-1-1-1]MBZ4407584.1 hypothetical protein [Myxococcus sp. XM-1-1-1]BDT31420.1 hypothetical protein MFMH1_10890 [Myxococcus sp. MH1]
MSSEHAPYLMLALMVLIALGIIVLGAREKRQQRQAWRIFATRQGWTFSQASDVLEVQGLYREQQLSLLTEKHGTGKGARFVTVLRLELTDALPQELQLETETVGDKFLKLFGKVDEEVGDAALDAALNLRDLSPRTRELLLTPSLREPLLRAHRHYHRLCIIAGMLEVAKEGVPTSPEDLEALVAPALALADALHLSTGQALPPHSRRRAQS